jgi:hypothetical protein
LGGREIAGATAAPTAIVLISSDAGRNQMTRNFEPDMINLPLRILAVPPSAPHS